MKIFIGLPTLGTIGVDLSRRLREWYASKQYQITIAEATGLRPLEVAVNQLMSVFLETDSEYLFFINSDELVPFDTLDRFVKHDVDVVAALGLRWDQRKGPLPCVGVREGGSDAELARHFEDPTGITMSSGSSRYLQPQSGFSGLRQADRVGNSAMLIKRKVIEAVPLGSFKMLMSDDRTQTYATEDYAWCDAVRAAGFQIWVDCDVLLSHIKQVDLADVTRLLIEATQKGRSDSVRVMRKLLASGASVDEALEEMEQWLSSTQSATSK